MILFRSTGVALLVVIAGFTVAFSQVLYTLESPNPWDSGHFGCSVSSAGDVNADGYADVLVGADYENGGAPQAGRAYVFSGAAGVVLYTLLSPNPEGWGCFGRSVSDVGDVDGDGFADVVVGAPYENGGAPAAGRAYILSGATGGPLHTLVSPSPEENGTFGGSVSDVGDVDSDGVADVVIGATGEDGGATQAGRAYVFSGATGAVLNTLLSPNPEEHGGFGCSVSGAGDVNDDGYADVLVGASHEDGGAVYAGRAYVFSGATGTLLHTLLSPNPEYWGFFGRSVSGAGDVDNDGFADVVVGAEWEDAGAHDDGRAYVFSGQTGDTLYALQSPNPENLGYFGRSVSGAGDVDSDGSPDVVVGAWWETGGAYAAGRAYLFGGQTGNLLFTLLSPNPYEHGEFGYSVAGAGDVNADGIPDVLVGAYWEAVGAMNPGRAYVFNGIEVPVELASFTCVSVDEGVLVEWATYSEDNNYGFHVYRSDDPSDCRQRITEDLIPGAGTTTVPQTYTYLDPIRKAGNYLYWLEQIDIDGSTAWHGPVEANVALQNLALLGPFPNPTSGEVRVVVALPGGATQNVDLRLYDAAGRLLAWPLSETMEGSASHEIAWHPEADIAPGLYWWTLSGGNHVLRKPMVIVR